MKNNLVRTPDDSVALKVLYKTIPGRIVLKGLTSRGVSKVAGAYLDSKYSRCLIKPFVDKNNIDMSEYEDCDYPNFNSFFCRRIKPELRPVEKEADSFVSPCDGLLSVYKINHGLVMPIKQSCYSVGDLLRNKRLAAEYEGGLCMVFRLCVNHYHRYSFADTGRLLRQVIIPGKLHTVRPIALRHVPVFTENSRQYSVIQTKNFGKIVQMEVGAMLVGKIRNRIGMTSFKRGQEKGHFVYGGSTIVLLIKKDQVELPDWYYKSASDKYEIPVKMGQVLGKKISGM